MKKKDFKILVADDDKIARDVISSFLAKDGYTIVSSNDGLDAIQTLKKENINLFIIDLKMYGGDGIEVLKQAMWSDPDLAIIMLTTYSILDSALEALRECVYGYLIKPFKTQEIIFLAEKAYRRSVLMDENKKLITYLRDTYHDIELVKTVTQSNNPEITLNWIERMEKLKTMNVLTDQEAEILKERLIKGN
ncbi:MAG: response regulator [Nitrospirota bacterium]